MAALHRSLVQDQIADVTECSICTEIFTNPKILPCVHTFCLHCLEKYGKEKKPGDQMVCPICRKEFLIPDGSFSHLPSNFFIGKMVEIGKLAMTQTNKALCALCPEEEEVLAQLFCFDCEQNLCTRCGNGHKKSRFGQNHQVVELGSQLNSSQINLRSSYCDHHPGEQIKMFCYEDNVAIGLVCCVESHQSHRCVNVNKAAGEFTQQLRNSMTNVADRLPECEEVAQKLEIFKKEFEEEVFKTEEGIRDATTQLKKLIDQHTEILVRNLKLLREQNLKAFEITKQDVDRFKVMIDSFSRYSEELLARGSLVDVCRAANQMLTRGRELEMLPANCSGDCFRCDSVSFHCSNIMNFLEQYGKNIAVGELIVIKSSHRLLKFIKETPDERESEDATPPQSSSFSPISNKSALFESGVSSGIVGMADGGDEPSSFIVVDVEGDLKDFENEDSVYELTRSYLSDIQRSGGGKFASGGFVKNAHSQKLQYVAHYANVKSAERVLKRHEHCIEVYKGILILTVRPCPPYLKKVLEKETPLSDGQNSSGSSDIEVISRDWASGFSIVDVSKGSTWHTGDVPAKPHTSEIHPSALSKDATLPRSSDSSPCGTPESFDNLCASKLDQWSRSIIIENVPQDMFSTLRLLLENKGVGGGNIITYERVPTSNNVLATFEDSQAAENFLAAKTLHVLRQVFSVRRPLLLAEAKDTLSRVHQF